MFEVPATLDPQVVYAFFAEKRECYFPMNFDIFLGENMTHDLVDRMLVIDPDFAAVTKQSHVAPAIWLLAKDVRLSHIKRAIIMTSDAKICFIRETRPGKCYSHLIPLEMSRSPKEHLVRFGTRH